MEVAILLMTYLQKYIPNKIKKVNVKVFHMITKNK